MTKNKDKVITMQYMPQNDPLCKQQLESIEEKNRYTYVVAHIDEVNAGNLITVLRALPYDEQPKLLTEHLKDKMAGFLNNIINEENLVFALEGVAEGIRLEFLIQQHYLDRVTKNNAPALLKILSPNDQKAFVKLMDEKQIKL